MLILFPLAFIRERCQIYTSLEVVKVKSMCIALITSKEKETDQCTRGLGRSSVEGTNELGHPVGVLDLLPGNHIIQASVYLEEGVTMTLP